jgi:hypothetical protein
VCIALLQVGDTVSVHVDYDRRSFVAPNHTMTHVLNYALRHVLIGNGRFFDSYAARRVVWLGFCVRTRVLNVVYICVIHVHV